MRLVSVVVPDWLIATTSVSRHVVGAARSPTARWPARASTRDGGARRRVAPRARGQALAGDGRGALADDEHPPDRARRAAGSARRPGSVSGRARPSSRPSRSTSLPRSVLRNDAGASEISLSRKCGTSPRSMSRVVICAVLQLVVVDRRARVPSYDERPMPSSVPAPVAASSTTTWPRLPPGCRVGRRLAVEAQVRVASPRRGRTARWRRRSVLGRARRRAPGRCPAARAAAVGLGRGTARAIATEPSNEATVARNASSRLDARRRGRRDRARGSPWRRS